MAGAPEHLCPSPPGHSGIDEREGAADDPHSKDQGIMITDAKPYNEYFLLRRMARVANKLFSQNIVEFIKNKMVK